MTVFEKLLKPIEEKLAEVEAGRKKHHNERLSWLDFMRVLVFFFASGSDSRNSLETALAVADERLKLPRLSRTTITEAFQRFDPALARALLGQVMVGAVSTVPELGLLGQLMLIDGSYFRLSHLVEWERERVQGVKLHLSFSLQEQMAVDFVVDSAHSNEREVALGFLRRGALYVMDRGYMSYALIRRAGEIGARVIIRAKENLKLEVKAVREVTLPAAFEGVWSDVRDVLVVSGHEMAKELELRLVEFSIGATRYRLVTNDLSLTTFEVIMLYGYRWQIEIMFRYLKHVLGGKPLITESQRGLQTYFSMMFVTAILYMVLNFENLIEEEALASEREVAVLNDNELQLVATHAESVASGGEEGKKKSRYWPISINSYVSGGLASIGSPF